MTIRVVKKIEGDVIDGVNEMMNAMIDDYSN